MNPLVAKKFNTYPPHALKRLKYLRKLIFDVASELDDVGKIVESLKWGEPSYTTKVGSPIRINWKESTPELCFMYFHCRTTLIETFKEIHEDIFCYQGNRAIVFHQNDILPERELKQYIAMALRYHKIKHLPLLGA